MSATRTLRVMLVEDNDIFRELLAFVLGHEPDFEVVAKAGSLAEARETLEAAGLVVAVAVGPATSPVS